MKTQSNPILCIAVASLLLVGCQTNSQDASTPAEAPATVFAEKKATPVEAVVVAPPVDAEVVEEPEAFVADTERVVPNLPKHPLATLNEADVLLELTNQQYNDLVALLEERTTVWKALLSEKGVLGDQEFQNRKNKLFGDYSKKISAIFTAEQLKIWRQR